MGRELFVNVIYIDSQFYFHLFFPSFYIYNNVLISFFFVYFLYSFLFSSFSDFFFEKVLWFANFALPLHSLLKNPAFLVVFS